VWFDEDTIPVGQSITLAVEEGIEHSRTMILCLSTAFLEHEWPQAERAAAQFADPTNRSRTILPVVFSKCKLPKLLAHLKYVSYLRHNETALDAILEAVQTPDSRPPPVPPSEVSRLLDSARDSEREQDYAEAMRLASRALDLAEQSEQTEPTDPVELSRARQYLSHYLLRQRDDAERAWELANASADPAILQAYPERLFDALCAKAEAAIWTRRFSSAEGAIEAAAELQDGDSNYRELEQTRGSLALHTGRSADAVRHYENAKLSFSKAVNGEPDATRRRQARLGRAVCLTNLAVAHRATGHLSEARTAATDAANSYQELGATVEESAARRLIAACHFDDGDWNAGSVELERAEDLARRAENTSLLVDALELKARLAATLGNNEAARDALVEAIPLSVSQPAARRRSLYQMCATVYGLLDDSAGALRALDTATVLAGDDRAALLKIQNQRREIESGDVKGGGTRAPDEIIGLLANEIVTEFTASKRADLMRQLGSAHFSRGEVSKAAEWLQRSLDTAASADAMHVVVDAYLGLAQVALHHEDDQRADGLLTDALSIAERLPHWAARASIITLQALLCARRNDLRKSLRLLDDARTIAFDYNLREEIAWIETQRQEVEQWLSLGALPSCDLSELADEVGRLEDWFPEERSELRRLWWYWRGDDVIRNLKLGPYVGSLVVTDDPAELIELERSLSILFDLTTFSAESSFTDREPVQGFVPIPEDLEFPYVNYLVLDESEA